MLAADEDIRRLDTELADLQARAIELDQRQAEVEAVTEAGKRLKEVQGRLEQLARQRQNLAADAAQMTAAREAAAALPQAQAEARALSRLANRFARLDLVAAVGERSRMQAQELTRQAADARARQAELDAETARGEKLDADIRQAETALADAETALRGRQEMDELTRWRDAYRGATAPGRAQTELTEARGTRATLLGDFTAAIAGFRTSSPKSLATALESVEALLTQLEAMFRRLNDVAYRVGYLEGAKETLDQQAASEKKRQTAAERRLREIGVAVPADEEAANTRLAQLEAIVAGRLQTDLEAAANAARTSLSRLNGERDAVRRRVVDLTASVRGQDAAHLEDDAGVARQRGERATAISERHLPVALATLGARKLTRDSLAKALADAQGMVARRQAEADALAEIQKRHARDHKAVAELESETASLYQAACAADAALPVWSETLSSDDLEPFRAVMVERYRQLGGASIREQRMRVASEIGNAEATRLQAQQRVTKGMAVAKERLRQACLEDLLSDSEIETIRAAHASLAEHRLDAEALGAAQREALRTIGALENRQAELDRKLRLGDEALNLEACQAELERMQHEMEVRERGRRIIEQAHTRIKEKVLPATVAYMGRILPQLTNGRYEIVHLSPDFKIEVMDERVGDTGGFRPKDVFSGGCRDQVSLALRLSFALATLPEERGAAPSFIFLDEPLGAFDDERAEALLTLLTDGEIGQAFDQIFLVSHVRVDESAFDYRIRMEGGRVVEHNLPNPTEVDATTV